MDRIIKLRFVQRALFVLGILFYGAQAHAQVEVTSYVKYKSFLLPITTLVDPIAPQGLIAEMRTAYTLTIEWESHVAGEEYVLFWQQPGENTFTEIYRGPGTKVIRPNLQFGVYRFRVMACGGELCSGQSAAISASVIVANDRDLDGVLDHLDECEDTFFGQDVDSQGCADSQRDDDGDGINNTLDLCAGTAPGQTVSARGCVPTVVDTDGDGVTDDLDACAGTAADDEANSEGCGIDQGNPDRDGDGIINSEDPYPLQHASQCTGV